MGGGGLACQLRSSEPSPDPGSAGSAHQRNSNATMADELAPSHIRGQPEWVSILLNDVESLLPKKGLTHKLEQLATKGDLDGFVTTIPPLDDQHRGHCDPHCVALARCSRIGARPLLQCRHKPNDGLPAAWCYVDAQCLHQEVHCPVHGVRYLPAPQLRLIPAGVAHGPPGPGDAQTPKVNRLSHCL